MTVVSTSRRSTCVRRQESSKQLDVLLTEAWQIFWQYRLAQPLPLLAEHANPGLRVIAQVLRMDFDLRHNSDTDIGHLYELLVQLGVQRRFPREYAVNIYGRDVDPALVPARSGHHQLTAKVDKQFLWSVMDERLVAREAEKLCRRLAAARKAGRDSFKIGSLLFGRALGEAMERVARGPRVAPWHLEVDVAAAHPEIGLLEVKASGHIGSQKVQQVIERHLGRALAVCRPELEPRFATFYRNKDDQNTLRHFASEPNGLLSPERMAEQVFDVSHEHFLRRFELIGQRVGEKLAFSDAVSDPSGPDGIAEYQRRRRTGRAIV